MKNNQLNNNSDNLINEFLGDVLFDEDTTRLKQLLLELDNKNRKFFIKNITGFIDSTKKKLGGLEDIPQEFIDMENRVNAVLKEINPPLNNANKTNCTTQQKKAIVFSLIVIVSIMLCFTFGFCVSSSLNASSKTESAIERTEDAVEVAENAVAVYLTKNYNSSADDGKKFMSFEKIYHSTKLNDSKYIVELSGSANIGRANKFYADFYAKVSVSLSSDKVTIEELTFDNKKIVD